MNSKISNSMDGAKSNIKVCYFIYTNVANTAGGSFYSLRHHYLTFQDFFDVSLINYGRGCSPALKDLPNYWFFPFVKWNIHKLISAFIKLKSISPHIIHAYDFKSLFIARIFSLFHDCRIVYTKCGGANGSRHIPSAHAFIFFSKENYDYFKAYKPTIEANYVPNRIQEIRPDWVRIDRLREDYGFSKHTKVMIRVSRINRCYDRSFSQAYKIFEQLKSQSKLNKLVFIGAIQDMDYYKELNDKYSSDPSVHIIVDSFYTTNAAALLPIASVVMATGRGVMEACSFGLRVFCPIDNGDLPVELSDINFNKLFEYNFSERCPLVYNEGGEIGEWDGNTKKYFEENFAIKSKIGFYQDFYNTTFQKKLSPLGTYSFLIQMLQFYGASFRLFLLELLRRAKA
jgi:hypothetical protein